MKGIMSDKTAPGSKRNNNDNLNCRTSKTLQQNLRMLPQSLFLKFKATAF
jgi:hypothetical protein